MPTRILREGINSSPRVGALSMGAEVFYRRLMSVADDYGRYHGSVVTLRGACWPTNPERIREKDVSKWLTELLKGDDPLVKTYCISGSTYLEIQNFGQQIRGKSKFPDPPWHSNQQDNSNSAKQVLSKCEQSSDEAKQDSDSNCLSFAQPSRSRSRRRNTKTEGDVVSPLTTEIREAATRMHDRHPQHRTCGLALIEAKLRNIVQRHPVADRIDRIKAIDANHALWCAYWAKDTGSTYAKALENWLAPAMGRFDEQPPTFTSPASAPPPRLMFS